MTRQTSAPPSGPARYARSWAVFAAVAAAGMALSYVADFAFRHPLQLIGVVVLAAMLVRRGPASCGTVDELRDELRARAVRQPGHVVIEGECRVG